MSSLEQGCSYEMPLPVTSEGFVAERVASSTVSLVYHGCPGLCCENSFLSLAFLTNSSEIPSVLKLSARCQVLPEQFPQATEIPPEVISCLVTSGWCSAFRKLSIFPRGREKGDLKLTPSPASH